MRTLVRVCEKKKNISFDTTSISFTSKSSVHAKQEFPYVSDAELDPFNLQQRKSEILIKILLQQVTLTNQNRVD